VISGRREELPPVRARAGLPAAAVALGVGNQSPDGEYLAPMMARVRANCGAAPTKVTADAGDDSDATAAWLQAHGRDPYLATQRSRRDAVPPPVRGRPPARLTARQRMARTLRTQRGAAVYARRNVIAEPVVGPIKNRGLRGFLVRGRANVRGEWALMGLSHNLLKLHAPWAAG
jgi:hypothetical protein